MLLITLILGGSGATMPPPAAEIARHVIDAFLAKDYERAAELQLQFALFPSKWMHRGLAPVHVGRERSQPGVGRLGNRLEQNLGRAAAALPERGSETKPA